MGSLYLWGRSIQEMGGDVMIGRSIYRWGICSMNPESTVQQLSAPLQHSAQLYKTTIALSCGLEFVVQTCRNLL